MIVWGARCSQGEILNSLQLINMKCSEVRYINVLLYHIFLFILFYSNETKEVLLLLVKVKALHIVEDFIEKHKLEHLKLMIGK